MWRSLIVSAAVVALTVPAFAQATSTTTIEKRSETVTRSIPKTGYTVSTTVIVPTAPPAPWIESPPALPFPAAVWEPGHWRWVPAEQTYTWVQGIYARPPHEHAAWQPGHWRQAPNGWVWVEGRWD